MIIVFIVAELLAKGCTYDAEQEIMLIGASVMPLTPPPVLDDGMLLQTLTECVAQLERKTLSINMKKEIESAQKLVMEAEEKEQSTMNFL